MCLSPLVIRVHRSFGKPMQIVIKWLFCQAELFSELLKMLVIALYCIVFKYLYSAPQRP